MIDNVKTSVESRKQWSAPVLKKITVAQITSSGGHASKDSNGHS
jgi:hypothetical protein